MYAGRKRRKKNFFLYQKKVFKGQRSKEAVTESERIEYDKVNQFRNENVSCVIGLFFFSCSVVETMALEMAAVAAAEAAEMITAVDVTEKTAAAVDATEIMTVAVDATGTATADATEITTAVAAVTGTATVAEGATETMMAAVAEAVTGTMIVTVAATGVGILTAG